MPRRTYHPIVNPLFHFHNLFSRHDGPQRHVTEKEATGQDVTEKDATEEDVTDKDATEDEVTKQTTTGAHTPPATQRHGPVLRGPIKFDSQDKPETPSATHSGDGETTAGETAAGVTDSSPDDAGAEAAA